MRIAFAGGGTGGHIVPGLHLLGQASTGTDGPEVEDLVWFTSGREVESRVLAAVPAGLPWERVELPLEPPGGGAPSRRRLLSRTPGATLRARSALRRHRPDVLLGLGGFTTLPAALAARSLGIPTALLEINAAPGRATRFLSRTSRRVFHAWRESLPPRGADERHVLCGAPVAPEVLAARIPEDRKPAARAALGFDPERPLLVVLGGSQGAGSLNAFVREHAELLLEGGLSILHQCGPGRRAEVGATRAGWVVEEFVAPISGALAGATLALSRGGASTLAELAAACVPSFIVPYPHHADRHQERNALELGDGVRLVADAGLGPELARSLVRMASAEGLAERQAMRAVLDARGARHAAATIWRELELIASR